MTEKVGYSYLPAHVTQEDALNMLYECAPMRSSLEEARESLSKFGKTVITELTPVKITLTIEKVEETQHTNLSDN